MAVGTVIPIGVRGLRTLVLDAVPARGDLEVVSLHSGRADPRHSHLAAPRRATGVSSLELQQLRRVAGAVARLRGEAVRDATVRSDLRQLKVELESGLILVVSAERDAQGRPHLEVDVVDGPRELSVRQQLEVRFE